MSAELNNSEYQPGSEPSLADDAGGGGAADGPPEFGSGGDVAFVSSEEKKPLNRSTLALTGFVIIGAAALYYMQLRAGPSSAKGATNETANATINQFLSGGESNMVQMQRMLRDTEKVVQQFLKYPSVPQVPLTELHQNPFRQTAAKTGGESVSEAEAKRRKEEERQAIVKAVQGLQLQSILHSSSKNTCMINNTMYQQGQQIDGFTIETIKAGSIVVKNGSYRFELKMQH